MKINYLLDLALSLQKNGDYLSAENLYIQILDIEPENINASHLLGTLYYQNGKLDKAIKLLTNILKIDSNNPIVNSNLGLMLQDANNHEKALEHYDIAIKYSSKYSEAYYNKGDALMKLGRFIDAIETYNKSISYNKNYAKAYNNCAYCYFKVNDPSNSLLYYDLAIKINPNYAEAYSNQGLVYQSIKKYDLAIKNFLKCIEISPNSHKAYNYLGCLYHEINNNINAIKYFENCISIFINNPEAYYNIAKIQVKIGQVELSFYNIDKAISLLPDNLNYYITKSEFLIKVNKNQEAIELLDYVINKNNKLENSYTNKAIAFKNLNNYNEAIVNQKKAIELKPDCAEFHSNLGVFLFEIENYSEALNFLNKAITLDADKSIPFANRAAVNLAKKDIISAISDYKCALEIDESNDYLLGQYVHAKMSICDWSDIELDKIKIKESILNYQKISSPFPILYLFDDPKLQFLAAKIYSDNEYPFKKSYSNTFDKNNKKIILGYFSADFTNHPVSLLTIEMFEVHDKEKFIIYGFSLKKYPECDVRKRLKNSFTEFFELENCSDLEVSNLSRKLKVDIAIDLGGHTKNSRPGIFSLRSAPIQISYLGYLGTMGAKYYDYIIADEILIPKESEHFYIEKIIYLPSYQCNDSKRRFQNHKLTKKDLNLPNNIFIYCCFNNNFKISPECFGAWMKILKSVPQSILFLYADSLEVINNLSDQSSYYGISKDRLYFSNRLSLELYYARFKVCDLFLDTWPYNAGTTSSDALMTGLPVLTKMGDSFASRICSSILNSLYMQELSTANINDFIDSAIKMGVDPIYYAFIKNKLLSNLKSINPLFNTNEFVSSLEKSYAEAYSRFLVNDTASNIKLF